MDVAGKREQARCSRARSALMGFRKNLMSESVTETTNEFPVERNDRSQGTVLELTTFLIHRETRHRAAIQVDYFLDGVSLIRDQSDPDVVP